MKSILGFTGVSPLGRYVRPTHFISLYPTPINIHTLEKNSRGKFLAKTFVERSI
jgi:hypothetical protein